MSSSEQCVDPSAVETRSEAVASPSMHVIGPFSHPLYSINPFPLTIRNRLFPIHSLSTSDLLLSQSLLPHAVPAQFKSWPRISAKWEEWDFSSRRKRLQQLEGPAFDVVLSFADVGASTPSQLAKSFPSVESLFFARTAMQFYSEYPLLDSITTIFSDSDAAQAKSTLLMAKLEDFHNKRRQAEIMEQESLIVRTQINDLTAEYDANESEMKKLEEKIHEHRTKWPR
ncbi:hypothetical protein F511_08267 [Dorcoceras hygrometricum]|uniref:Uncharacterized protein n=1 Tax=Dorcoceras hygrometricum TaxID=472368 RepID=A0A2Z7AQL1_9LAMI|nr:hypothetical protein F511_08267 [Dorcoceras hygrometricum]